MTSSNKSKSSCTITIANVPEPSKISGEFIYNFYVANETLVNGNLTPISGYEAVTGVFSRQVYEDIDARERGAARARIPRMNKIKITPNEAQAGQGSLHTTPPEGWNMPASERDCLMQHESLPTESVPLSRTYNIEGTIDNSSSVDIQIQDPNANVRGQRILYKISSAKINEGGITGDTSDIDIAQQLYEMTSDDIDATSIIDALSDNTILGENYVNEVSTEVRNPVVSKGVITYPLKLGVSTYAKSLKSSCISNPFSKNYMSDLLSQAALHSDIGVTPNPLSYGTFAPVSNYDFEEMKPELVILSATDDYSRSVWTHETLGITMPPVPNYQEPLVYFIGYVVEKSEVTSTGQKVDHRPMIKLNSDITEFYDPFIRYGSTYIYKARQLFYIRQSVVVNSNYYKKTYKDIAYAIASRSPSTLKIPAIETNPPPPPGSIICEFDYEAGKGLRINWQRPPNPERDIKKYQVFRRKTINDPFELIAEYDFTDPSYPTQKVTELIPEYAKRKVDFHVTMHRDKDYDRHSSYIYTVASIDAHGMTSGYGVQVRAKFNKFTNKVDNSVVSRSGAPKQYPNMYLKPSTFSEEGEKELILDAIKDSNHQKMRIYFNPTTYIYKTDGSTEEINRIVLSKDGLSSNRGFYKFQIVNLDRQKTQVLTIKVNNTLDHEIL